MAIKNISQANFYSKSVVYQPNVVYDVTAPVETYLTTSFPTIIESAGTPVTAGTEVLADVSGAVLHRGCAAATLVAAATTLTVDITGAGAVGDEVIVAVGTGANVRPGLSYNVGFTVGSAAGTLDINAIYLGSSVAIPVTSITVDGAQSFLATIAPEHGTEDFTMDFGIGFNNQNVQSCVISLITLTQVV